MAILKGCVLAVGVVAGGLVLVVYAGLVDVAASHPHGSVTNWALGTAMERAVRRNAFLVVAPTPLPPPEAGAREYAEMCVLCHGAPGKSPSEVARGLMPPAPDLARVAGEWSDAELYWIIENGVKMTGMPAWGASHSEQELWVLVSFVRLLPKLTAEQYATMTAGSDGHMH